MNPSHRVMAAGACSIVIPVYNRATLVRQTIESCLGQDYPTVEIIIVDDGSTDGSSEVLQEYAQKSWGPGRQVRHFSQPNSGACTARNLGMSVARGEFLLFLDSDDLIPKEKLSRQIAAMQEIGADCCICDYRTIDTNGNPLNYFANDLPPLQFIARLRSPANSTIVMRRSSVPSELRWDPTLQRLQDLDFMLRYLATAKSWTYLPEALYLYRLHDKERISDSYTQGIPYVDLFRSMNGYLQGLEMASGARRTVIAKYSWALVRHQVRTSMMRMVPRWTKTSLKRLFERSTRVGLL